jgi:hypothetical protein
LLLKETKHCSKSLDIEAYNAQTDTGNDTDMLAPVKN